ncbi:MAG: PHB depolymerase family esterase [Pseudomonadota bacterium]
MFVVYRQLGLSIAAMGLAIASVPDRSAAADPTNASSPLVTRHTLTYRERVRSYVLIRSKTESAKARPLVIALHGGTRSADHILKRTRWPALAIREGFVLVTPNAYRTVWNDGRRVFLNRSDPTGIDDVGFLAELIRRLTRTATIDRNRVYLTGVSNGGIMTWRFACERHDLLAAIAPTLATMSIGASDICLGTRPLPTLAIFGTADRLMRFDGQAPRLFNWRVPESRMSARQSTDWWAQLNGCQLTSETVILRDLAPDDGTTLHRVTYNGCPDKFPVVRYDVQGGGHIVPGARITNRFFRRRILGRENHDAVAEELIWSFFRDKSR